MRVIRSGRRRLAVLTGILALILGSCLLLPLAFPLHSGSPEMGPTHYYVQVDGKQVHYVRTGMGRPVILLHAGGTSWHDWESFVEVLSASYTVIAPDFPGSGDSAELDGVHNLDTYTSFLEHFIDALGFTDQQIGLIGMSFGGMTALNYALENPTLVDRLVLIEVPARYTHAERRTILKIMVTLSRNSFVREGIKWWVYQFGSRGLLSSIDLVTGRDFVRASSRATIELLQSWSEMDLPPNRLAELRIPVLLIVGENDKEVPPSAVEELKSYLPEAQLLVVPGANHANLGSEHLGKGGLVDTSILDFLSGGAPQE